MLSTRPSSNRIIANLHFLGSQQLLPPALDVRPRLHCGRTSKSLETKTPDSLGNGLALAVPLHALLIVLRLLLLRLAVPFPPPLHPRRLHRQRHGGKIEGSPSLPFRPASPTLVQRASSMLSFSVSCTPQLCLRTLPRARISSGAHTVGLLLKEAALSLDTLAAVANIANIVPHPSVPRVCSRSSLAIAAQNPSLLRFWSQTCQLSPLL